MSTRVVVEVAFEFATNDHAVALARATAQLDGVRGARIKTTRTYEPTVPEPYSDTDDTEGTPLP